MPKKKKNTSTATTAGAATTAGGGGGGAGKVPAAADEDSSNKKTDQKEEQRQGATKGTVSTTASANGGNDDYDNDDDSLPPPLTKDPTLPKKINYYDIANTDNNNNNTDNKNLKEDIKGDGGGGGGSRKPKVKTALKSLVGEGIKVAPGRHPGYGPLTGVGGSAPSSNNNEPFTVSYPSKTSMTRTKQSDGTTWKTTITTTVSVGGGPGKKGSSGGGGGGGAHGGGPAGSTGTGGTATVTFENSSYSSSNHHHQASNNKRSATDANLDSKSGGGTTSSSGGGGGGNDEEDDDDESDDGCLHCHSKVKNLPYIRKKSSLSSSGGGKGNSICDAKSEPKGDRDDDNGLEDDVVDDDDDEYDGDGNEKSNVQVRCDECGSYICRNCHWCHEYQANHEIRVCDRCDGFYCKGCDEMDQCDDCHEVVCGGCSTLLSCKFCGGGLCEDCATACGRCGIVLCSRDAKFAVDCDTCRLSYCLVCLASGSKEPCVRCGHRPSKRMEQLVHLRLKSIYKAFKSTKAGAPPSDGSSAIGGDPSSSQGFNPNDHTSTRSLRSKKKGDMSLYEEFLNANKVGVGHRKETSGSSDDQDGAASSDDLQGREKFCYDLEQNYLAEKKKADDAAAELLAELEEEEVKAQKKSKKKKKKGKGKSKQQEQSSEDVSQSKGDPKSGSKGKDEKKQTVDANDDSSDEEDGFDQMLRIASGVQNVDISGEEEAAATSGDKGKSANDIDDAEEDDGTDPVERELEDCIESMDMDGIEDILDRLKGVPGRAVLRKNAKKALKRLRAELEPDIPEPEPDVEPTKKLSAADAKLSVPGGAGASNKDDTNYQSTTRSSYYTPRADTVIKIKSRLVGWMIGKGGQRIRDIMEESGAKIWIDQESTDGGDWRNVNINGDATSREIAVRLINDVVENAPPPPGATTKDEVEIIYSSSDLKSGEVSAWSNNAEKPATLAATGSASATQSSSAAETAKAGTAMEILTCEPRFVALLIGKRGWTIKNIQDESGARVDINQNVTPRQIKISGTRASVDRAVGLVQDVLSYPHAQLHGTGNDGSEAVIIPGLTPAPVPAEETPDIASALKMPQPDTEPVAAEAPRVETEANETETPADVFPIPDRNESPPPIVGDAKSAISASSSLSSTPEPSMASSAKGLIAAAAAQLPAPVLPPTPEQYLLSKSESAPLVPGSFQHPGTALGELSNQNAANTNVTATQTADIALPVHQFAPPVQGDNAREAERMKSGHPPGLAPPGQSTFNPQLGVSLLRDQLHATGSDRDGSVNSASRPAMDYMEPRQVNLQPSAGTSPSTRRSTAGMTRAQIIASTPLSELMGNPGLSRSSSSPIGASGYERDDGRRYPTEGAPGYNREYDRDGRRYVEGAPRGYNRDDGRRFARSHSNAEGAPPSDFRRGYEDDRGTRRSYHSGPSRPYGRYEEEEARRSYTPGMPPRSFGGGRYEEERRAYQSGPGRPYDARYEDTARQPASYQSRPPPASYDRGYGYDRGFDRDYDRRFEAETGGRRAQPVPAPLPRSSSGGAPVPFAPGMRSSSHGHDEYGHEHYNGDSLGRQPSQNPQHHGHTHNQPGVDNFSNIQGMYSRDSQDYRGQNQLPSGHQESQGTGAGQQMFSSGPAEGLDAHKGDELGIINSLFGAPSGNETNDMNAATDSLLAGLTGLGLSNDTTKPVGNTATNTSGGLWGPSSLSDWGGSGDPGMDAIGASLGDIISGTSSSPAFPQQTAGNQQHSSSQKPSGGQF